MPTTRLGDDGHRQLDDGAARLPVGFETGAFRVGRRQRSHHDLAVEFGGDEGADDRQPETGRRIECEPGGHAAPVVDHRQVERLVVVVEPDEHRPAARTLGEAVIDGVLEQLGEHDRQRRRDRGRDPTAVTLDREHDRPVRRLQPFFGQPEQRADDLDERHVVARLARKRLVDERDRANPTDRLADGRDRLGVRQAAGLQPQQRRDRLEVVLDAVVDLTDRRVLAEQQPIALAEFGDIAEQEHTTGDLTIAQERHTTTEQRDVLALFEFLDHGLPPLERLPDRTVVEAELCESEADRRRLDPDPVERRAGVR